MSSEEDFEELEKIIIQKYNQPEIQHSKLESLENDPNFFTYHQFLLENSDAFLVLIYCSKYLLVLVRKDDPIWNGEIFSQIFEWIPKLFQNRIEIFFRMNKQVRDIVTNNLIELFVYIFSKLWNSNSKLSEFCQAISELMPDIDLPHRELRYLFFKDFFNKIVDVDSMAKIQTQIVVDKIDKSLFGLFTEVVESNFHEQYDPSNSDHVDMIQAILDLLYAILRFYNKKKKESSQDDESDDFFCDLSLDFRAILEDEEFLTTLFSFFEFSLGNNINYAISGCIFQILNQIVSLKQSYYSTTKESNLIGKIAVIGPIIVNITKLLSEMNIASDQTAFSQLSNVVYRMSNFFEEKMVMEIQDPFYKFLEALFISLDPYLTKYGEFIKNNQAIVNLMKFWSAVVSKNSSFTQIAEMATQLFQKYIDSLINSSQIYLGDIINILDLDKYIICDAIQIIPGLLKSDFAALGAPLDSNAREVFESYKNIITNRLSSQEDLKRLQVCDIQMSLYILIMTSGLRNNSSNNYLSKFSQTQPDDFEKTFFEFIIEVIKFTDEYIQEIFSTNLMLLERSLYVFARSFRRTVFARINEAVPEQREDYLEYFNIILKRLIDALYGMHIFHENHSIAFNNLLSIENIYDYLDSCSKSNSKGDASNQEILPLCYEIEATKTLVDSTVSGEFQFAADPETCIYFKNEIKLLTKIVRSIVAKNDEAIQPFLESIEKKFAILKENSDDAIFIFIYELIGIFSNDVGITDRKNVSITSTTDSKSPTLPYQNSTFREFFDWVFPNKLEMFVEIAPQAASNVYVCSAYLKFWYVFMSQVTISQQSLFQKHSPDAIILFTMIAKVIISYFDVSNDLDVQDDTYQEKLKPLKYVMLLMSESLSTDYIMYGAFELYEDTTLINLINKFIETIQNYEIDLIFNYPKVAIAFMKLVNAFCKNHLNLIVVCSPPFFDYLFTVTINGLTSISQDIVNISVEAGTNMANFLQTNKISIQESIERNQDVINQIITIGFDIYLSKGNHKLIDMIGPFLTVMPNYLEALKEEMGKQISEQDAQDFNYVFQVLIQTISESYLNKSFNSAMSQLKNFSDSVHLKVPVP